MQSHADCKFREVDTSGEGVRVGGYSLLGLTPSGIVGSAEGSGAFPRQGPTFAREGGAWWQKSSAGGSGSFPRQGPVSALGAGQVARAMEFELQGISP